MEPKGNYVFIGAFVLLAVLGAAASLLWLSKFNEGGNLDWYNIYFTRQSLSGLQVDSQVTMKGIKVGAVSEMRIDGKNIEQVKVTIRLNYGTPVKTDTQAIVRRNLLTGLSWIELIGGTQNTADLLEVIPGELYPLIPEGITEIDQITDSLPSIVSKVNETLARVDGFFSEENVSNVSKIIKNVADVSDSLVTNQEALSNTMASLSKLADQSVSLSESVNKLSKNTNKTIGEVGDEATKTLVSIREAADAIKGETAEVGKATKLVSYSLAQNSDRIAKSVSELSAAVASAAERYEDPKSLIAGHGKKALGPGE